MSEQPPNEPPKPLPTPPARSEDRALAALNKRLAKPQPKAFDAPAGAAVPELGLGSGSATGFVGTLAKRNAEDSRAGELVQDMPRAAGDPADQLQVAREVPASRPTMPPAPAGAAAGSAGGGSATPEPAAGRHGVLPVVMILLAVPLLLIGSWAVGALMYMHSFVPMSPRDVTYPLIAWRIVDLHTGGAYTTTSVAMAWSMLACLPVGTILLIMGWKLRKAH